MPEIREYLKKCSLPAKERTFKKNAGIKVLYAGFHKNATGFYRAVNPAMMLESEYGYSAIATCFSVAVSFSDQAKPVTIDIPAKIIRQADYLILATIHSNSEELSAFVEYVRSINKMIKIYMDIDDALWMMPPNHPMYHQWKDSDTFSLFNNLALLDGVISPNNEILNSVFSRVNIKTIFFPNLWNIYFCATATRSSTLSRPVFKTKPPYRMVSAINQTHYDSFHQTEYVNAINVIENNGLASYTNIGWDGKMPGKETPALNAEFKAGTDFLTYIRDIHRPNGSNEPVYDIALIPIFQSHYFYKCKAFQKALEYISAGIPVITGDSAVYDTIPCVKRLMQHDLQHNIDLISYYLNEPEAREKLITMQRQALNEKYLIHSEQNINLLKSIFTKNTIRNEKVS